MMYERVTSALGKRPGAISHSEMRIRQQDFCSKMTTSSIAIITNNPVATRSRDTHHRHRFNSYLHYLTGWHGEDGVAVFHHSDGNWNCRLYVQPRDVEKETWTGRRPGLEGALSGWPVDETTSRYELAENLSKLLIGCEEIYHVEGLDASVDVIVKAASSDKILDPRLILDNLRVIKSESEIELMQYSADLAAYAHVEAMRECKVNISEWHMQSIIEEYFLFHQSK